jgi:transcriptional regulator with XRE-family HTH domain
MQHKSNRIERCGRDTEQIGHNPGAEATPTLGIAIDGGNYGIGQERPSIALQTGKKGTKSNRRREFTRVKTTISAFLTGEPAQASEVTTLIKKAQMYEVIEPRMPETMPERIESLIERTGCSYYEIAKAMGVARSTVHDVRKGLRPATKKFMAKFTLAEARMGAAKSEAGILTPMDETVLLFALDAPISSANILSAPNTLEVKTEPTVTEPDPKPITINLNKPDRDRGLALVIRALTRNECNALVIGCLEEQYATQTFVEKLDQPSYLMTIKCCVRLILGLDWEKNLRWLAEDIERRKAGTIKQAFPAMEKAKRSPEPGSESAR